VILGAWLLWKNQNYCVLGGGTPSLQKIMRKDMEGRNFSYGELQGVAGLSQLVVLGF
jgi:hypothetical protein